MSVVEVMVLLLTLVIGISIIVSTLRIGISPMPSSSKARYEILALIQRQQHNDSNVIAELGSGWGHLAIAIAKANPDSKVTGFEVSFFPWLVSVAWAKLARIDNVTFKRSNFLAADLTAYQMLCCYLFPAGMQSLSRKLNTICQQTDCIQTDRILLSNTFALPEYKPVATRVLTDLYRTKIYTYHW